MSVTTRSAKGSSLTWAEMDENFAVLSDATQDRLFFKNRKTITANTVIPTDMNFMSIGSITIADGVTVTVSDGAEWTIV